jgi:serine/threonine protein kinase/tetratricopeptide (TPR) repeat protein
MPAFMDSNSDKENPQTFSYRYEILQDLGEGGIGKVYKAYDRWIRKDIALKVLTTDVENPTFVESFKKEFLLLSQLKHAGVVEVLDFGFSEKSEHPVWAGVKSSPNHKVPYFTMEFVEGKRLSENFVNFSDPLQAPGEFDKLHHLIWQISDILEFLHLRRIVHCDLKPDNLKVTDQIFRPKILDFGLSEKIGSKRGKETKGTLPYMAPEMFKEEPLDGRTDLYSLGIILYELVTSRLPFPYDDPVKIVSAHLEQKPIPPSELNALLPPSLNELIMRLLEKSPADRPCNATQVKEMIETGLKRDFRKPPGLDFPQKNSLLAHLYSGPLVGREDELNQLEDHLKMAISSQGVCVYLSGELGVGKTFLLQNLKTKCQVQGIIFVDSNCLENHTSAYQPLIEILHKLEPYVKNQCPDLIFQSLRDVFKISSQNSSPSLEAQALLHRKICQLLVEISRALPLVIVIENLQWSDLSTLKFLEYFQAQKDKGKIFMCCSLREEKLKENASLQTLIDHGLTGGDVRYLKIERFDLSRTQNLILSKLTQQKFPSEFFAFAHQRTSGNPFFILEVLKYLLENKVVFIKDSIWTTDLERLKELGVPDSIEAVLLKNLKRYDEVTLDFLNVAAVIGKRFSLRLVKELNPLEEKKLTEILTSLTNDQLLLKKEESAGERVYYEFANQSLQSLLYQRVDKDKRIFWHQKVGELLEKQSLKEEEELVFEIAYHYLEARELDKAYQYALLSAEKMEQRFANPEVLRYLESAINVASEFSDRGKSIEKRVTALMKRADFCKKVGELNQAERDYQAILKLIKNSSDLKILAETYNDLGEIYRLKHDYKKGILCLKKAMEIHQKLDSPVELANTLSYMGLLYRIDSQYENALTFFQKALKIDQRLGNKSYEASTLNNMGLVYWSQHQYSQALKYFTDSLSLYRDVDNKEWKARTLNNIGATHFHLGDYKQAINYYLESLELNERIKNNKEITFNLENLGDAYRKIGDYNKALNCCQRGLELALEIDYTERAGRIFEELGVTYFELGRYQEAYEHFDRANTLAEKLQDKELQVSVLINLSKFFTLLNVDQKAMHLLEEATEVIDAINDEKSLISVYKIESWLKKKERKFEEASKLLDEAFALATKLNVGEEVFSLTLEYAELYLDCGETEKSREFVNRARNSGLDRYVLLQPAFYLISGRIESTSGNLQRAQKEFETGLKIAQKLNNLEILWRIHHQLGKLFLSSHDVERAYQELENAGRVLKRLTENIKDEELKQSYLRNQEKGELLSDLKQVAKELIGETKIT